MNILILLTGKKRTGKDTFAGFLTSSGFIKMAFADAVKDQLTTICNQFLKIYPPVNFRDDDGKDKIIDYPVEGSPKTVRFWMQKYGQLMKKIFGQYLWSDILIDDIFKKFIELNKNIVISDARFSYEILRTKERLSSTYDIVTIRIKKDTGSVDSDISETELDSWSDDEFDFVVDNNGALEDLHTAYKKIIGALYERQKNSPCHS